MDEGPINIIEENDRQYVVGTDSREAFEVYFKSGLLYRTFVYDENTTLLLVMERKK